VYNEILAGVTAGCLYKSTSCLRAATASPILGVSLLVVLSSVRHHLAKGGSSTLSQLIPKLT
jgi:hypothetical protein